MSNDSLSQTLVEASGFNFDVIVQANCFPCYNHRSIKRRTFINLLISISYWSSYVIIVLAACGFIEFIWDAARIRINMKTILGSINKYSQQMKFSVLWYTWLLNFPHRLWYIGCILTLLVEIALTVFKEIWNYKSLTI